MLGYVDQIRLVKINVAFINNCNTNQKTTRSDVLDMLQVCFKNVLGALESKNVLDIF